VGITQKAAVLLLVVLVLVVLMLVVLVVLLVLVVLVVGAAVGATVGQEVGAAACSADVDDRRGPADARLHCRMRVLPPPWCRRCRGGAACRRNRSSLSTAS
jgi:hypothetical protein